jgi:hypothetical protein
MNIQWRGVTRFSTISFTLCARQEQDHPHTSKSMFSPPPAAPPPESRAREFARRYGVWLVVLVALVAGIIFYFRYQSTLVPVLGGGK